MSSQRTLVRTPIQTLVPRHYSTINWVGLSTLYMKEVRRFMIRLSVRFDEFDKEKPAHPSVKMPDR